MQHPNKRGLVVRLIGGALAATLVGSTLVVATPSQPAFAAMTDVVVAGDLAGDFTVLAYGNANLGNAETEGSVAVGGVMTLAKGYPFIHSSGLTPTNYSIPVIDGQRTRVLASSVNWAASSGASDVTSRGWTLAEHKGYLKLGPASTYAVNPRGSTGLWVSAPSTPSGTTPGLYVPDEINQPSASVRATNSVLSYFANDQADALVYHDKLTTRAVENAVV